MVVYFITHAEVDVEPSVRIEEWGLSAAGRARVNRAVERPWMRELGWFVSSTERKAVETAQLIGARGRASAAQRSELGELDRSATGYLPPAEFEATLDLFFSNPLENVRGWESAQDAQRRVVDAAKRLAAEFAGAGAEARTGALVAHGGVGNLLLCDLLGVPISRAHEQPGLGSYFVFDPESWSLITPWERLG